MGLRWAGLGWAGWLWSGLVKERGAYWSGCKSAVSVEVIRYKHTKLLAGQPVPGILLGSEPLLSGTLEPTSASYVVYEPRGGGRVGDVDDLGARSPLGGTTRNRQPVTAAEKSEPGTWELGTRQGPKLETDRWRGRQAGASHWCKG